MNMRVAVVILCFIHAHLATGWYSGMCRVCRQARSLEDCTTWADCGQEECYLEEVKTDAAQTVYNGGCKGSVECQKLSNMTSSNSTICRQCCNNGDLCNENLCGIQKATNMTLCNQCDGVHRSPVKYPEDCPYRAACQSDEMCFASTYIGNDNTLRHETRCRHKTECQALDKYILQIDNTDAGVGRRNSNNICSICCGDDMCNVYACETIKQRLRYLDSAGLLDRDTLKEKL